jgi:hypothetical protein
MPINGETKPAVMALFDHVKNHDWEPLNDFREFRGDQDNAIAYLRMTGKTCDHRIGQLMPHIRFHK